MATRSIGSGQTHSTIQDWEDTGLPATYTEEEVGEIYDAEVTSASQILLISGHTNGTYKTILRPASGQAWNEHANVRTNALRYNTSNGVGIRCTAGSGSYVTMFDIRQDRFELHDLQFDAGANSNVPINGSQTADADRFICKNLIIYSRNRGAISNYGTNCRIDNCHAYFTSAPTGTASFGYRAGNGAEINASSATVVSDATAGATGFATFYGGGTLSSSSCFGFTTAAGTWSGGSHNATDLASGLPGTDNQHSVTYSATTPFTQADSGSALDWRPVASTSLADNGTRDATNAPDDMTGTARDSTPTIGPWELAAAGGGGGTLLLHPGMSGGMREMTGGFRG